MNKPEENQLLDEVLGAASPPDFRAALLGETLRHARRRRHWRQARQAAGGVAVLLLAGLVFWPRPVEKISPPAPTAKVSAPEIFQLVETRPLPAAALVTTKNFTEITTVFAAPGVTEITTSAGGYGFINDAQLLALLDGHPAALVRTGPNSEDLVFADPEDRKRLLGN